MSETPAVPESKAERWDVPALDGSGQGMMTASHLQEVQKAAHEEAFEQGYREGLQAGQQEVSARVARLDALLQAQAKPLDDVDDEVEKQIVDLALKIVAQLFRRELKSDPDHVVGVVREAVGLLPVASREVQVFLHPEDATLVRNTLTVSDNERAWSIVEDPLIARGGCRVSTDTSQIDASNETRLQSLIASIRGEERQS